MSFGPSIFWTTLLSIFLIIGYATLVGRMMARFFPEDVRADVRFYLAPAFGLALILIFVAVWGRYVPFGDSALFTALTAALVILATAVETDRRGALRHAAIAGLFSIAASVSLLSALWYSGALNPHNDTFTYLAQSDWLQTHAFRDWIVDRTVTPASSQVSLYQYEGFRMGGTYLLGLFHSLLNIRWAFDVYPAVVGASAGAAALAVGLPAARALDSVPLWMRLAGLSVVGNSLGGVSFAAHYGFMPQGYGILFGAAALFAYGLQLDGLSKDAGSAGNGLGAWRTSAGQAFPIALLLAASIFSYSEIAPFVITAAGLATLVALLTDRRLMGFIRYGFFLGLFTGLFLNIEIIRSIRALKTQAGAVVGSPIDWHVMGYIGHALGLHGGGWDIGQWTLGGRLGIEDTGFLIACAALIVLALAGARALIGAPASRALLPTLFIVALFGAGLVYFRYVAKNPFPIGTGQSWSQFKLANWSHVFVVALLMASITPLLGRLRLAGPALALLGAICLYTGTKSGMTRTLSLKSYYIGERDLSARLKAIRASVLDICGETPAIYLDLTGNDHKFRQMLTLYLADRKLKSDWTDDGYIENQLPRESRAQPLNPGECLIESRSAALAGKSTIVGEASIRASIGPFGEYRVGTIENDHPRESGDAGWWLWVGKQAKLSMIGRAIPDRAQSATLAFWIGSERDQDITVVVTDTAGRQERQDFALTRGAVEKSIPLGTSPKSIASITFQTTAEPEVLGKGDHRKASFLLRNVTVVLK